MSDRIEIARNGDNDFTVSTEAGAAEHLTWDEMLGQVAALTMPARVRAAEPLFRMTSHEGIRRRRELEPLHDAALDRRGAMTDGPDGPEYAAAQAEVIRISDEMQACR